MADKKTSKPSGEEEVAKVIAAMPPADRTIAEKLDAAIRAAGPDLTPRLWYGQPAYAKGKKVVCFFRGADVDKERYLSLGFSSEAQLDDGHLWPTAYAVTGWNATVEKQVKALVRTATG